MKNLLNIALGALALFIGFKVGTDYMSHPKYEEAIACGYDQEFTINTYNEWLNEALVVADKRAEKHPVKVINIEGIFEYNKPPKIAQQTLYNDYKNSKICDATLLVNYTPMEEQQTIEKIHVRFQKVVTSPNEKGAFMDHILSSGYDVESMREQALELFKKYNKDKK